MKYDAFISYRHAPYDMEIAKKLHRSLETFTIPAAVAKKTGKKKIRRVFRDQEELPIGSSLTDKINAALQDSEYLIVVCSPETPGSEWVRKEIQTFISLHDHSHVLAILIDGDPRSSFPKELLTDETGASVEPLAADIRGADKKERNRKFRTELLRLAAPVIGCTFDDLKQRHKERLIRKAIVYVTTTALITGGAGAAFGVYNASIARQMEGLAREKGELANDNAQLALDFLQEYREKQINQSRFYATRSLSLLSDGYRKEAALVALAGLPAEGDNRPYVSEAEYALSRALHAYDTGEVRDHYQNLTHELPVSRMWANEDNTRLATLDSNNSVHIWDTDSWEECTCITPDLQETNHIDHVKTASADADTVYIVTEESFCAYDYTGALKYRLENLTSYDHQEAIIAITEGIAFLTDGQSVQIVQLSDGTVLSQYANTAASAFNDKQRYNANNGLFMVGHNYTEGSPATITVIDSNENRSFDIALSDTTLLQFCYTPNGNIAALSCNNGYTMTDGLVPITLDLVSPDGQILWTKVFTADIFEASTYSSLIRSHTYPLENGERCGIVCTIEDEAFTFDEADGSQVMHMNLPASATSLLLSRNNRGGYIAYTTGDTQMTDLENGRLFTTEENLCVPGLKEVISVNTALVFRTANDKNINVIDYQQASDLEVLPTEDSNLTSCGVSPNGEYYVMENNRSVDVTYAFFDPDGMRIYDFDPEYSYNIGRSFCGTLYVIADKFGIHYIDPIAGTTQDLSYPELGIDINTLDHARFTQNGDYAVFWDDTNLYLVDMKQKTCIYQTSTVDTIGAVVPFENGSELLLSENGKNLSVLTVADDTAHPVEDDRLRQIPNYFGKDYLAVSANGKYAAMCCLDQKLWIIDLQNGELSCGLPMQLADRTFLRFSDDGRYLFVEGNDYILRIWDVKAQEYINSFFTDASIKNVIADNEDGKLALITGYSLYLLDLKDYGLCTYVPDCCAYLPSNNAFIQYRRGNVYRCYYKDYQALIEETQRQFPGAALTNEQKVEYNVE